MNWQEYFPTAMKRQQPSLENNVYNLPLDKDWLQVPLEDLTERERFLVELLRREEGMPLRSSSPWQAFLAGEISTIPHVAKRYQFLYIEHSQQLSDDVIDLFGQLLVGTVTPIAISPHRTALLLPQETGIDLSVLFQDVLATMESDFGLSLNLLIGNNWAQCDAELIRELFRAENDLFSRFLAGPVSEKIQQFPKTMLWAMSNQYDSSAIKERLKTYLHQQEEIAEVILALWETHGNQVQAAQRLYVHRNSLQYKLEKFHRLSGLNLKKLDDLALCYWLLLEM